MSRLQLNSGIFIGIIFLSVKLFAQEPLEIKEQLGSRHAKIPQIRGDTGMLFDEFRLEKAAHDYFNQARFSGTNACKTMYQIEKESYEAIRGAQDLAAFKSQSNPAWQSIGGSQDGHASGRVRSIAFDPTDSKIVYIAAASGGIWKTLDITTNPVQWINLSDRLPTVNFGAIAVDPKRPNIVFAGTGESQGDNYREQISGYAPAGSGIFKSTDGGLNWNSIATPTQVGSSVCSQIVIDPINTDTIYIATGANSLLKTYDGGATWKKVTVGVTSLSIAIDPVSTNRLYMSGFGSIYRSVDYGETWVKCITGLPGGDRITIALAPSAPNTIYASIGAGSITLGVWVSDDYGVTWRKQFQYDSRLPDGPKNKNPLGTQEQWCNSIVVSPTNPARIFVAGLDIYLSNDSGKNLNQISDWRRTKTESGFVHADIHFLAFNGNTLYACTDGGIANTQNPFSQWNTSINKGIATLQFVGVDANKEFTYVTGGCQDNSTNRAWPGSTDFHETIGGDGGHAWVSQEQGNIAYTTYVYANFKQALDSAGSAIPPQWSGNLIQPGIGPTTESGPTYTPFYTVYDCSSDGQVIALGGNAHVWVSTSGGQDGFPNKSNVVIGNSYAINVSQQDASFIWAASGGNIFRSSDQGATWAKQTSTLASTITGIASNPNNTTEVYACATSGKHFFKSSDGGMTYTTPAMNLPNIPCWSVAFNPVDGKLFLGTEKGVFFSADGGVTWFPLMNGLPYVQVTQLRVRGTNNDKLLAGTYGRGMFWLDISNLVGSVATGTASLPLSLDPSYPNPITSSNASMNFTLNNSGIATITLFDVLGRELRVLDKNYFEAGKHQVTFMTNDLAKGTYFVMLTANGRAVSQKIILE